MFWLKLLSKVHESSLVSILELSDKFHEMRIEFELTKGRKVKFYSNLNKVHFQKAEHTLWNFLMEFGDQNLKVRKLGHF